MMGAYLSGFGMGAGLIIAIGAQNAYVLVQAIRRNHHFLVAGICACIDVVLIAAGVLGVGSFVASSQLLRISAGLGGAAFLLWFGCGALRAARSNQFMDVAHGNVLKESVKKTLATVIAVSLLNPHVYLDTVVMLGGISGHYSGDGRYFFGIGAATASVIWFFSLAFFGAMLAPVFARPRSWQILNIVVCGMVWLVAAGLLYDVWQFFL